MSTDALAGLLKDAAIQYGSASGSNVSRIWADRWQETWAHYLAARGVVVLPADHPLRTGQPSEAMIGAALNVSPERKFVPAIPYGGALVPELSREEMRTALRAALAVLR